MVKLNSPLDANFWHTQKNNPFRVLNTSGELKVAYNGRKKPRKQKSRMRAVQPLNEASAAWRALTQAERDDWDTLGATMSMTGWQAFTQRATVLQKIGETRLGVVPQGAAFFGGGSELDNYSPEEIANYKCMQVIINSSAGRVRLEQAHPDVYNIRQRIPQSVKVFETVEIYEPLILPLEIGISWRSRDIIEGDEPQANFYAEIEYDDEGTSVFVTYGFSLATDEAWQRDTLQIPTDPRPTLGYSLFVDISDMAGIFEFDNIAAIHTGSNWAIDATCDNVHPEYLPQWGDINPTWKIEQGVSLAQFSSVFIT